MLKKIAKNVIQNPGTRSRTAGVLDNYVGNFSPKRINIKNIIKYRTFFPMWDSCEIEINSFCNRDCKFCPRYADRSGVRKDKEGHRIRKEMPSQKVYDIIDELKSVGYKGVIRFGRLSEPLVDRRYAEFVGYAKSMGFSVEEPTNGDVLRNNPEMCEKLDGLVDKFVVGLYDWSDENEIREQQDWFRRKFKKTKIDFSIPPKKCVLRQGAQVYTDYTEKKRDCLSWPCLSLHKRKLLIRYDGEVSLCCEDDVCSFELGNVFSKSIREIWWSDKHKKILSTLKKAGGKLKYVRCRTCYVDMDPLELF